MLRKDEDVTGVIAFSDINQKYYKAGLGKPGGLVEARRQAADEARNVSEIRET